MTSVRTHLAVAAAAALALGVAASSADAAVCSGACGSLGANGDVVAAPGASTYGWVSSFGGASGVGQLPTIGGTDGSTFTTSAFNAAAGQNLQYYFNYITSDGQNGGPTAFIYEDYASVQLVDATTGAPVAMLFNARTEPTGNIVPGLGLPAISPGVTLNPGAVTISAGTGAGGGPLWSPLGTYSGQCWGPGCGQTGWVQSNYTIGSSGVYKLVFGVTNWADTVYDSGLAFSGINIGGVPIGDDVPEPATWAMMLIGVFAVGALARRRTRAAA